MTPRPLLFALALLAGPALAQPAPVAAPVPGETLFRTKCGFCHIGRNTGTIMLSRRLGPAQGELAKRTDLDPAYIRAVVRGGLMSMPAISRVEVTANQLDQIAAYLTRANPKAGQ
jgi:mono/diheme cytochrome c family protein